MGPGRARSVRREGSLLIRTDDLRGRHDHAAAELLAAGERFEAAVVALISELVHRATPDAARIDLGVDAGPDGDVYTLRGLRDGGGGPLDQRPLDAVGDLLAALLADLASIAGTGLETLVLDPAGAAD
jgi:hypothetical protein